jgi:hypothetical protein
MTELGLNEVPLKITPISAKQFPPTNESYKAAD